MKIFEKIELSSRVKWLLSLAAIILLIFLFIVISSLVFAHRYNDKIYPGLTVNDYDLGGLTQEQASKIIEGNFNQVYENGLTFTYQQETRIIHPYDNEILSINNEAMANYAYNYGRNNAFWKNFYQRIFLLLSNKEIKLDYQFNKNKLQTSLQQEFTLFNNPAEESQVIIDVLDEEAKTYEINFTDEKNGAKLNFSAAIDKLDQEIKNYNNPTLALELENDEAQISKEQAALLLPKIEELLQFEEITFIYEEQTFVVNWHDFTHWISLTTNKDNQATLSLNKEMVMGHLESISQQINQEAKNAKFQMKDNRVSEFQASQSGLELDQEASYSKINYEIITNHNNQIDLIVNTTEPEVNTESLNELGIKELIGAGTSNFSGSPANRRHNIGVGAATLNGMLIAPDEEFSLVNALGDIDAQSGYLPELVIKGDKTIPEYGGGLCQIATTLFRNALDTGLKITEREPHSYRVSYYEPAGTDSTIYQPHPDLRFINDTGNYILLQTSIQGNELFFEMYGTSDGRIVEQTDPIIFNITYPGPTKIVETTELAPGQKKCTESAHNGADAVFTRTITYGDGTVNEEEWRSHYSAWRAVCLVGVDPNATTETTE